MAFLLFFTAIVLSGIAAYYSVIGLIAIFSAAALPVAVMGGSLEVAKLVVASWLYRYWQLIPVLMKIYFTSALAILMLITSMGIFGFLSKAHNDQSLVSGDVLAKISIYDERIKTERDNIEAARKALTQMDAQVNERLSRSSNEQGAERAVQIRRQQQAERARLQKDIAAAQTAISKLQAERAPIAAEVRKVEAEVGPIKYIAALIYGDNPDTNLLERAVRWLIILLICVFDPLAVLMLIAANLTQVRNRELKSEETQKLKTDEPTGKTSDENIQYKIIPDETVMPMAADTVSKPETQTDDRKNVIAESEITASMEAMGIDPTPPGWMFDDKEISEEDVKKIEKKLDIVHKLHTPEPQAEEQPKKKVKKSNKKSELDINTISNNTNDIKQPVEQNITDKSLSEGIVGKPISVDNEVQRMIDNNDQDGLEEVYKKIVKELAKKNRAKSTHWGPIKNKNG